MTVRPNQSDEIWADIGNVARSLSRQRTASSPRHVGTNQRREVEVGVARQRGDVKGVARTRAAVGKRQISEARPVGVGLQRQAAERSKVEM